MENKQLSASASEAQKVVLEEIKEIQSTIEELRERNIMIL
jgi:hypothetical protein